MMQQRMSDRDVDYILQLKGWEVTPNTVQGIVLDLRDARAEASESQSVIDNIVRSNRAALERLGLSRAPDEGSLKNDEAWGAVGILAAEVGRLRAVVERLPKDAGGEPYTFDRPLFHPDLGPVVLESADCDDGEFTVRLAADDGRLTTIDWCYSTPEAAAAARGGGE